MLTEINPLVESDQGQLIAVDARLNVDDNGLFKHPELLELKKEFAETKEIYLRNHRVEFVYTGWRHWVDLCWSGDDNGHNGLG